MQVCLRSQRDAAAVPLVQEWTGEENLGAALQAILLHLPHAQWVITTLGGRGSILLQRQPAHSADQHQPVGETTLNDVIDELMQQTRAAGSSDYQPHGEVACTSPNDVAIGSARALHCIIQVVSGCFLWLVEGLIAG